MLELIIHNAPFDISFIDNEFRLVSKQYPGTRKICSVIDTLVTARKNILGKKNNLDALCKRYAVDNSQQDLHGALLGCRNISGRLSGHDRWSNCVKFGRQEKPAITRKAAAIQAISPDRNRFKILFANQEEK